MKKIAFFLVLLNLTQGCGFTPLYISNNNTDFNIESVTYEGDQELNNYINIGLKKYISQSSDNTNFKITAKTDYKKIVQTNDAKGNAQTFKLESSVIFLVTRNNKTFNFIYSEQSDLNNSDDAFELKSYENTIKQIFASSMIEKLLLDLSNRK